MKLPERCSERDILVNAYGELAEEADKYHASTGGFTPSDYRYQRMKEIRRELGVVPAKILAEYEDLKRRYG